MSKIEYPLSSVGETVFSHQLTWISFYGNPNYMHINIHFHMYIWNIYTYTCPYLQCPVSSVPNAQKKHHKENSWESLLIIIARIKGEKHPAGGVFPLTKLSRSGKRNIV